VAPPLEPEAPDGTVLHEPDEATLDAEEEGRWVEEEAFSQSPLEAVPGTDERSESAESFEESADDVAGGDTRDPLLSAEEAAAEEVYAGDAASDDAIQKEVELADTLAAAARTSDAPGQEEAHSASDALRRWSGTRSRERKQLPARRAAAAARQPAATTSGEEGEQTGKAAMVDALMRFMGSRR